MKSINYKNEAQKQWNLTPCGSNGEVENNLNYFLKIEKERYSDQNWMKDVFFNESYLGKKILEIGFGQGTDLVQFAKLGAECYGIDITKRHYDLANTNFKLRSLKANLFLGDASKLPFDDEYFDIIYSFGVLHHTPDIDKCIDEAYRVLKKDGIIMITLYNKYSAFYRINKLFVDGLLKLWIFKLGIKGLRSTIEFGADGKRIKPLVKLYTKRKAKKLMSNFKIISINIKHLKKDHFWKFGSLLSDLFIKKLENLLGWYIVIKAKK